MLLYGLGSRVLEDSLAAKFEDGVVVDSVAVLRGLLDVLLLLLPLSLTLSSDDLTSSLQESSPKAASVPL